ncbi:MAG: NAD(P)/FAD-dependent oxidoreductase [Vallitaleaceae bacterium]|jgi:uncharacterized FAD-dependent dehydrogenase|nr:NAD(P)/FAD-dependent oxidoreductase [Vallitaleaceae bacterium]
MSNKSYDVIIIGGGPAGIFASLELMEHREDLKILLVEKGRNIEKRNCPSADKGSVCTDCNPCSIVSGWGGAGAFSDGKLTLTTAFGGVLDEYIDNDELLKLIDYVDKKYVAFGGTEEIHGEDMDKVYHIAKACAAADIKLIPAIVKHLGTDKCFEILRNMQDKLLKIIDIQFNTKVEEIIVEDKIVKGIKTSKGETYYADYVIAGPGREGSEWFREESKRIGLDSKTNAVDIGVRVELPAVVMKDITDDLYESKMIYYTNSFDDRVRTFCMNPYGKVVLENNSGIKTVNGHSYADKRSENTNFALLVSKNFTEPFDAPIEYGKSIANLSNMISGGVIVQRLGDLRDGRRTTTERLKRGLVKPTLMDAVPGDLSLVLPYRFLIGVIEMLEAMDKVAPGVFSKHTLLYGVEVKFYSSRIALTNNLETQITNLFAVGDGAGITRGLAQASVAGVVAAREILSRKEQ